MSNEELWAKYKKKPTDELKKQIMVQYTNLVHYVIQNSKFARLDIVDDKDFFQFGVEGLSEAVDRFDPDYGTKFETYAIQRIRGKIIDELRKLQKKPRVDGKKKAAYTSVSLNHSFNDEEGYQLYETIPDDTIMPDEEVGKKEEKEFLLEALKNLEERDRLIITLYYYENLSYKEIAEVLGVTVSRVSQIHSKIIEELKHSMNFFKDE